MGKLSTQKITFFDIVPTVYYFPHCENLKKNSHTQNQILPYSNLFLNCKELGKTLYTKKFPIFHSFPTPYHLRQSDRRFTKKGKICSANGILPFFKLLLNCIKLEKTFYK